MNDLRCPNCSLINPGQNPACSKCGERLHFPPVDYAALAMQDAFQDAEFEPELARPEPGNPLFGPGVVGIVLGTLFTFHRFRAAQQARVTPGFNDYETDKQKHFGVGRGETNPETGVTRYL